MRNEESTRLSLTEFFQKYGGSPVQILEMTAMGDKPGPALCTQGCLVEIDAICAHGCPSVVLTLMQYDYEWDEIALEELLKIRGGEKRQPE